MRESIRVLCERANDVEEFATGEVSSKEPAEGQKKRPSRYGQVRRRHATQPGTRRGQSGEKGFLGNLLPTESGIRQVKLRQVSFGSP